MNLRVFYLTRRGISDGYTIKPAAITYVPFTSWSKLRDARIGIPNFSANTVPDSNVSPPRRSRISSQTRSCLAPCSTSSMGVETKLLLLVFVHSF